MSALLEIERVAAVLQQAAGLPAIGGAASAARLRTPHDDAPMVRGGAHARAAELVGSHEERLRAPPVAVIRRGVVQAEPVGGDHPAAWGLARRARERLMANQHRRWVAVQLMLSRTVP